MGETTNIAWTLRTQNFWVGCQKISPGCKNCLHPDTLVLYENMTWNPLKDVKVGDVLVGFNDSGKGLRLYQKSIVEGILHTNKPAVKFRTEDSEIICSKEHKFLSSRRAYWYEAGLLNLSQILRYISHNPKLEETDDYKYGYIAGMTDGDGTWKWEPNWGSVSKGSPQCYWRVAVSDLPILHRLKDYLKIINIELEIRNFDSGYDNPEYKDMYKLETRSQTLLEKIYNVYPTENPSKEFCRGWLAGMFDAEGSHDTYERDGKERNNSLRIANTNLDFLRKLEIYSDRLGFNLKIEPYCWQVENESIKKCGTVRLYGGIEDRRKFLSCIQPALQRKIDTIFINHAAFKESKVISIEEAGVQELIDIQTSTGNFYANGLATHNCYMFRDMERFGQDPKNIRRTKTWGAPIKWQKALEGTNKKEMVFTCSWSDFFIEDADPWRDDAWKVIKDTPNLIYQILTKRTKNVKDRLPKDWGEGYPNVALGTSIESDAYLWRADDIRPIPAKWRFISAEPLLGSVKNINLEGISWLIAGGESGADFRPMDLNWVRELRDLCKKEKVAFFYKQEANFKPGQNNVLDGKVHEAWPDGWA